MPWRPGRYLRNSGIVFGWLALRAASQAATVVLLSRALGADGYGRIVAITAVAALLVPLSGMGLSGVLLRDGTRDPARLPERFVTALHVWALTSIACGLAGWTIAAFVLPKTFATLLLLPFIACEIAASGLADLAGRYQQARGSFFSFGAVNAGSSVLRLAAVASYCGFSTEPGPAGSAMAIASANGVFIALVLLLGRPARAARHMRRPPFLEAAPFVIAAFSQRAQAEFNKPYLAHDSFQSAGQFAAAQRAMDIVALPLAALQEALWPRIYASPHLKKDVAQSAAFLIFIAFALGLAAAAMAPLLPWLLGPDFAPSVSQVRLLAALPVLQVIRSMLAVRLTHIHRTDAIGVAHALGAITSVLMVALLVPAWGWRGAVAAAYGSELVLVMMQVLYPLLRARPEPHDTKNDHLDRSED